MMLATALGAVLAMSCQGNKPEETKPEKPVVTAEMFTVTANAESGEVVFKFTNAELNPYWTVVDPKGVKATFTDRETTKTYDVNGEYKGTIVAFNDGGESDPLEFSFNIKRVFDAELSETENILIARTWKPYHYGYCSSDYGEGWDWECSTEELPASAADDRLTFVKDGSFVIDLGENKEVYNDSKDGIRDITITGQERWGYVVEGDKEFIQFSNGGFPSILGDNGCINGKFEIRDLEDEYFRLYYLQAESDQYFYVVLVPENFVEPEKPAVTEDSAREAISGKTFCISRYGWWGTGWEWFEEPVPAQSVDDRITFNADGSLVFNLGEDSSIYNDGTDGGVLAWTVTGNETWAVASDGTGVIINFDNGGFPLMLAGAHVAETEPDYTHGLNGNWTVTDIDDEGTVRLDIFQHFHGDQWMTVFLTPIAE